MGRSTYTPQRTGDATIDRNLDGISSALEAIASRELDLDRVTDPITFTAGLTVACRHGLGRPIRGWLVVYQNAVTDLSNVTPHAQPRDYVNLTSSGAATVRLLFF